MTYTHHLPRGSISGAQLQAGRKAKGWEQQWAAQRLGVSQPYLSLLEAGLRRVPDDLARKASSLFGMSAANLPLEVTPARLRNANEGEIALDLARLGYPGLAHLKSARRKKNPATILLSALSRDNLDMRLVEALPWLLLTFPDLNWQWLIMNAKLHDLQNRLGFITTLARRLAETRGDDDKAGFLNRREAELEKALLAREGTLCHESITSPEKRWLRKRRNGDARRWRLLTDLSPGQLHYDS